MSNDLIVKSNTLIKAGYQLTTNEQRLILCAIACIPKEQPIDPNTGYCVTKLDFVELGVNPKTANREIREACDRLFNRYLTIKNEQGEFKTRWVQDITKYDQDWVLRNRHLFNDNDAECKHIDEEDYVLAAITFSRSVIPFLTELKSDFTKYLKSDIAGFSGSYSFRFFEFIMQYQSTGYLKISIKDLRARLELENKYLATKDLRVYVIDNAIQEINEKSPYKVDYNLIKTGKKFTHLEMKFVKKLAKKTTKKADLKTRDENTPDMFSSTKMTDKQRSFFALKLSKISYLGCYAPIGGNYDEFAQQIEQELLDINKLEPSKAAAYQKALKEVGFTIKNEN